jgi:hypothetical protein
MFLLYHSDRCNTSQMVFHWCYVNDLHTTHAMVCWVTTETPLVKCGPRSIFLHSYYRLLVTRIIYILANYYLLPHNMFDPLFTANQ